MSLRYPQPLSAIAHRPSRIALRPRASAVAMIRDTSYQTGVAVVSMGFLTDYGKKFISKRAP